MTDSVVKVGDVVAWDKVPLNAMVSCLLRHPSPWYAIKFGPELGAWVHDPYVGDWCSRAQNGKWYWPGQPASLRAEPIIIALNLSGVETSNELRALADAFHRDHSAA